MSILKNLNYGDVIKLADFSEQAYFSSTFKNKHSSFLIQETNNFQYITFPGSYDIEDWIENAAFIKVKRDGLGHIHGGFADMWDLIRYKLLELTSKDKPIKLGGHSLGGAHAMIAALSLKNNGYNIDSVFTYGSPRVGSKDWFNNYTKANIPTYRIINGPDVVPNVPKLFYYHVGYPIYLSSDGKILSKQESAFEWKFWKITPKRFLSHLIENYRKNIYKFLTERIP